MLDVGQGLVPGGYRRWVEGRVYRRASKLTSDDWKVSNYLICDNGQHT